MDLFTHFLIPYIILFFAGSKNKLEGAFGGISIDFDVLLVFAGFLFPEIFILTHRGITHSFVFGFLSVLIFLYILTRKQIQEFVGKIIKRNFNLKFTWKTVLLAYFGVIIHLFLDYLTTGGLPILYPFTMERFSAHLYYYIDGVTTLISLTLLIILYLKINLKFKKIAMIIFVVMLISSGAIRGYEKVNAFNAFKDDLEGNFSQISTYPTSNMFVWDTIIIDPKNDRYRLYEYNGITNEKLFQGTYEGLTIENGNHSSALSAIKKANQITEVQRFLWYTDYICINAKFENNQWKITYLNFLGGHYTNNNLTVYVN